MRIRVTVLIAILFTVAPSVNAQLLEFGVKAGTSVVHIGRVPSQFSTVDDVAFSGGLYAQAGLGDLLSVGAELIYEGRSFGITSKDQDGADVTTDYRTDAICIPVMLKIGLPLKFMAEIGVQYSQFVNDADLITNDAQGMAIFGIVWRPLDKLRVGTRFQPGISTLEIDGIDDVTMNMTHLYVAWALF
jgi:hypothetical protein